MRSQRVDNGVVTWQNISAINIRSRAFIYTQSATCTTPPASQVNVGLPTVYTNEFPANAIGTTRGETNFNFTFSGCNQYMHAIRYKLYLPGNPPADNTNGLISLNNQPGSATGIKIQILDRNTNTPITLDQFRVAAQYTGNNTGFTIPFKARYYQSESQVTGGTVKAKVFFQIIYQ